LSIVIQKKMFGRRFNPLTTKVNWNGLDAAGTTNRDWVLEGQHCLVFFLGGIPLQDPATNVWSATGFSTNNQAPATPGSPRRGPFFEFKPNRLIVDPNNGFLVYQDPWAKPSPPPNQSVYAYFSSGKSGNDYFLSYPGATPLNRVTSAGTTGTIPGDCPSLGVQPYMVGTQFLNPRTYQIVTAGRDKTFAPAANAAHPTLGYPGNSAGAADMANFSRALLGSPQQQ